MANKENEGYEKALARDVARDLFPIKRYGYFHMDPDLLTEKIIFDYSSTIFDLMNNNSQDLAMCDTKKLLEYTAQFLSELIENEKNLTK